MQIRIITLRYHDGLQGFPEKALVEAAAGREILEVRDHFFLHGNIPHIAFVVLLADAPVTYKLANNSRPPGPDPEKDLPDNLQKLYRDLRTWRNERAKKDGVPSYVIMRNVMLADVCRKLPKTLAQLREIEGIGEATCAKYGNDILGFTANITSAVAGTAVADLSSPRPEDVGASSEPPSPTGAPLSI
ncbi:MAG: HRDC domain-containing protein [Candidatus Riflebacteria bacterium]|nr:HRDC domain-containing protein [Candidatus Riflebacteria bacterium]